MFQVIKVSKSEFLSEGLQQDFIQLIAKHTGLHIIGRDGAALKEKIFLRMKYLHLNLPVTYYQLLADSHPDSNEEWQNLVNLLTNSETYFFRDKEQIRLLRNRILPEIIKRKQNSKTIRICSAGCSSGEEPYSLAILLKELIPDIERWNLMILGIDINGEALEKAKTGIYSPWSFRMVDPQIKQRYFRLINNQYHIDSEIKQLVKFQNLNLLQESLTQHKSELQDIDLILCRNVFIYFDKAAIAKVLDKFYHALQPEGYLITGHAELFGQDLSQFQTKVFPESLVYQRQADNLVDAPLVSLPQENYPSLQYLLFEQNNFPIEINLENPNIRMQQTALNLLKQLAAITKTQKMGQMNDAELILQLEIEFVEFDEKTQL